MRKYAACLSSLILTSLLGFGFYSFSPDGIAEAEVLGLMKELHIAEKNKDEGKLKQILADKISWSRNKDERFLTKQQVIENLKNTEYEIKSTTARFISTKIEDNKIKIRPLAKVA